jgi:long-chain acyl-CoA synthetase
MEQRVSEVKKELLEYVNSRVNKSSRILDIIEQAVPFEKTATQKIKRYLYS